MFMRILSLRKEFNAGELMATCDKAFTQNGVRTLKRTDNLLVGDRGAASVMCHVMPIGQQDCHVVTVSASEDEPASHVCDNVASFIERTQHID